MRQYRLQTLHTELTGGAHAILPFEIFTFTYVF